MAGGTIAFAGGVKAGIDAVKNVNAGIAGVSVMQ
jgi:hypothetical protein